MSMAAPLRACPDCNNGVVILTGWVRFRFTFDGTGGLVCKRDPCGKDIEKEITCEKCQRVYELSDFNNVEFIETPFWRRPRDC